MDNYFSEPSYACSWILKLPVIVFIFINFDTADGIAQPQFVSCTEDINSCKCKTDRGTIDLSPLQGNPRFKEIPDPSGVNTFFYNPCSNFTEGDCSSVAVCQKQQKSPPVYFNVGIQNTYMFLLDSKRGLEISYAAYTDQLRASYIQLLCDPDVEGELTALGANPPGKPFYYFSLTSKYCCPGGPDVPIDPNPTYNSPVHLSTGSLLCLILLLVLSAYLIGGLLVQTLVHKQRGREIVPNYSFWTSLPGLVRDGVLFTLRRDRTAAYNNS